MASVYENHSGQQCDFYVLHSELDNDDFMYVKEIADIYNQKVFFITVNDTDFNDFPFSGRWPKACLYILIAHNYLPKSIERILYLDIDVIVNGNLTDFYNLEFNNCYMIVSKTSYNSKSEPENPFEKFDHVSSFNKQSAAKGAYFNSGVILFNISKFRDEQITLNYYLNAISDCQDIFYDQGILNICFAQNVKLLTTCKYNFRIFFGSREYFDRKNSIHNDIISFNYYDVSPKIIHYCGPSMDFKPWELYFDGNEIINCADEFLDLIPQAPKHFAIWWKYASIVPNYNELKSTALVNNAAYKMLKKITLNQKLVFCNNLGLETLFVPSWRNRNSIMLNENLNDFIKPRVYRCVDGNTKQTIKSLPTEFTEKCGFRLTVKNIAANSPKGAAVLQILEPNSSDAAVYRRYLGSHQAKWSPWYKTATTADISLTKTELAHNLQLFNESINTELANIASAHEESKQLILQSNSALFACNEQINNLKTAYCELDSANTALSDNLAKQTAQLKSLLSKFDNLEKQLKLEHEKNVAIVNSKSYKLGRFFTFIPRKIRDGCKKHHN